MPNAVVKKYAEKTGKSVAEVEKVWDEAKEQTKDKFKEDDPSFWAYVNGIVKKRLGLSESIQLIEFISPD